ncbi:MAG: AAA family ATPase [Muribaculaceae bacterium]|nr:AAA family ATPase [Muribaculaceae bacterium]
MIEIKNNPEVEQAVDEARAQAQGMHHEFVTPEHLLLAFLSQDAFVNALLHAPEVDEQHMRNLRARLMTALLCMPTDGDGEHADPSAQFTDLMMAAEEEAKSQQRDSLTVCDVMWCYDVLQDSMADDSLAEAIDDHYFGNFLENLARAYHIDWHPKRDDRPAGDGYDSFDPFRSDGLDPFDSARKASGMRYVRDMSKMLEGRNPLVGREAELERIMQVLCRKGKNNPLLIGESGVGKTAIVFGLAARMAAGDVPDRLKNAKLYMLDMGQMIAGSQYRGEMEDRLTKVIESLKSDADRPILFIDEMHGLMSSGTGDGVDAAGVLLPYLDGGLVQVIGTTTYEDFNRRLSRSKGLVRRCQNIDIAEPSHDETVRILTALKPHYEAFHQVHYADDVLDFAVRSSSRYIQDRYQPDKSIDLIDEAGAHLQLHPVPDGLVDKALVAQVLARMAKVDALSVNTEDAQRLESLEPRIKGAIYGQDEAVRHVVEAVQMAKAGLVDEGKPLASLLFVGPTGVGKTEVARVLAREMGVQLVRFDMSEFAEKHTVAKFIGSPAGYVGYDDGGQLTDAVRKNPDCVLLFDEIEKAHSDIFDILLQVMDYGVLTDNKGRKAHFQNVVIIMTSNAGAQWARQAGVGFASNVTTGSAMLGEVKKTFKPEFINRLSGIVVFRDMDHEMANLILDKKLRELQAKLTTRQVSLTVSEPAREQLLKQGYSQQYGAREMDRVITQHVKSLLMREILFGKLKQGGEATLVLDGDKLALEASPNPS